MNINSSMGFSNVSMVPKQQHKVASFQAAPIQFGENNEQKKPNWFMGIGGVVLLALGIWATSGDSEKQKVPQLSAQQIQQNTIGQDGFPIYDTNQTPSNAKK